jgi:hypothetical protein
MQEVTHARKVVFVDRQWHCISLRDDAGTLFRRAEIHIVRAAHFTILYQLTIERIEIIGSVDQILV